MATKSNLECFICQAEDVSVECVTCGGPFCKNCDEKFHNHQSHPNRQKHIRKAIVSSSFAQCNCCGSKNINYFCTNCEEQQLFCTPCDGLFHSHQERQGHVRKRVCSICEELSITVRCDECSGWYCDECDKFRHKKKLASHIRKQIQEKSPKEEIICGLEEQNKELTKSVEEYKTALEQLMVKKDSIVHHKEAQIQALENNFKSLQDRHEMEKVQHNREIQTKDSLIEEHISKARKQKEQTDSIVQKKEAKIQALENNIKSLQDKHQVEKESLEKENKDFQNQIKTLKIQVTKKQVTSDNEAKLPLYLPRKEGIWKKYSGGDVPEDGVVANDSMGYKWYVGRIEVDGDAVPGQMSDKMCHVFHNGERHSKSPCEVLVPNSSFEWIGCHGDEIPPQAVPGGKTKEGEVLYVGRVKHTDRHYRVGKVQPSLNGCYNRHARVYGDFTIYFYYEILVWK